MSPTQNQGTVSKIKNKLKKSKSLEGLRKRADLSRFSRSNMIIFMLVFGVTGFIIFRSYASTPLVATLEAEQLSQPSGGSVISDASASAGKAIQLLNTGAAVGSVTFPASVTSISVVARGTQCSGAPTMTVTLDGTKLINAVAVTSGSWTTYTANTPTTVNPGTHSYSVRFNNDYRTGYYSYYSRSSSCDRNLYVDVSRFYGPLPVATASPTISFSATPTSVTAGNSSTLTWATTNATACTAAGTWSGTKGTSGSVSTGALNKTSSYQLNCSGAGGSTTATTTVTVGPAASISATVISHNIDGNLSESDWNVNTPVAKSVIGTNNNSTTFGAMWDKTYLYVGAKVLDSSLKNDSPNCWDDDAVEVYVDPTNAGGTTYTGQDKQLAQRWNDTGLCGNSAGSTTGVLHAFANITGGYTVEMAIPWTSLGVTPSSGMTIGLDVANNDDDDGGVRDSQAVWNGSANDYTDPSGFARLTLAGSPGGTAPTPAPPVSSAPNTGILFGYQMHLPNQKDQANYVTLAVNGGAKTVRDDFEWSAIEPSNNNWQWASTDNIISQTAKNGLSVLAMVGYSPSWATGCSTDKCGPTNNADYADVAAHVAQRYGHNGTYWTANPSVPYHPIVGIEVWNEPNLGFWTNPNPAKYTAMLKAAYPAIKAVDPNLTVISAGLAPQGGYNDYNCDDKTDDGGLNEGAINQVNFLQAMYQNGAAGYMDAVGYHPYNWGGSTAAHYFAYHLCSGWSQMADTPVSIRSLMVQNGDGNKKIWSTETGGPTSSGYLPESEQASLATQLVTKWKGLSYAGNFYWYDLRDDCASSSDPECRFGTVRQDSTLKPSYTALKAAW